MRPSSIRYYFREGFSGMMKNRLMTVASIATVAACVFIMTFSFCMVNNLQYMLSQMEDSIGIAVFLQGDMKSDEIEALKKQISEIEHVVDVQYVSPEDALDEMKQEWDVEDGLLDGFSAENNPLSNSFKITLDGIENQKTVLANLDGISNIKVRHAQSETEVLMKLNSIIQVSGIVVILILGIISVVIIMNTIKISVFTRRNEINIMKYVGATDWFIRWPFIIEGVLIGFIGAAIPILISWPAYGKIVDIIYNYFPVIKNLATFRLSGDIFVILMPVALVFGILLGVVGSMTSIRKHLKV